MSNNDIVYIANAIEEINDSDHCSVLNEIENIYDPLIIRMSVPADSTTDVKYEVSDNTNNGRNPYAGGYYLVEVFFLERTPTVIFKTPIIHANVSSKDGYI